MAFLGFVRESGLKILALAGLSPCEYSIMLYLLNAAASGLNEFITTERELASLIGYDEETLIKGLESLEKSNLIKMRGGDNNSQLSDRASIRIGIQYDTSRWEFRHDNDVTSQDAVVFPFRRGRNFQVLGGTETTVQSPLQTKSKKTATWQRVIDAFMEDRDPEEEDREKLERDAKVLVETHPVDQVLLMLRHFGHRIPTLSLLASSWQHYQEIFEEENHKIDLQEARQKHHELDIRLKDTVTLLLEKKEKLGLSDEEVGVLEILSRHRHPRRQLFWAYQARGRYPLLKEFFDEASKYMLPVTTHGSVVKKW
jgi:hypothetical protein